VSRDLDPIEHDPQDACGVFGVWAPGEEVAKLAYFALYALQHRGSESAGIASSDGQHILVYKDMGLVSQVFNEASLDGLRGHIAVGHTRYSLKGQSTWDDAQPTLSPTANGTLALAHNGALTNTAELTGGDGSVDDTTVFTALLEGDADHTLTETALAVLPRATGAFSLVFMDEDRLYAARDPQGVHPLALGRLPGGGWAIASETAALDIVGASFMRDVEPGELLVIDETGPQSYTFAPARPAGCVFEFVYLARPDTMLSGRLVNSVRQAMGRALAREHPVEADLVIPVPDSGTPAAIGYAAESGITFAQGLTKNAYVGRTFIQPSQSLRQLGIRLKLNPMRETIAGKRLIVVDDSIVRGNTQRAVTRMLRAAGAAEVHVRISSPPVMWPCFYGIDFTTRRELIAPELSVEQVRKSIEADTLGHISLEGMMEATGQEPGRLCMACFDGVYPIPLPPGASPLTDGVVP